MPATKIYWPNLRVPRGESEAQNQYRRYCEPANRWKGMYTLPSLEWLLWHRHIRDLLTNFRGEYKCCTSNPLPHLLMSNAPTGGTCTAEEVAAGVYCLTQEQNVGLGVRDLWPWVYHLTTIFQVVALSGFVSLSAVLFIFTLIAVSCKSSSYLWALKTHSPVEERHLQSKICCG